MQIFPLVKSEGNSKSIGLSLGQEAITKIEK